MLRQFLPRVKPLSIKPFTRDLYAEIQRTRMDVGCSFTLASYLLSVADPT